jgi:hypothetical protein
MGEDEKKNGEIEEGKGGEGRGGEEISDGNGLRKGKREQGPGTTQNDGIDDAEK